ncbi:carbohydrate sulfotransferase 12-like [Plectropomus leopardus]|uniref:carbohydrate sulfotransferase 12-like n=1 Tax=Plectropomus leopardus TaxID=160734 RepID=UPI001C4BBE8E|nr:carbohydrate sulfotransferase 12-like [Plectropomus leopardus]
MRACRRFLLFFGIMGSMFLIYQWEISQINKAEGIHQLQELRKQQLREKCNAFTEGRHSFENMSNTELRNLVVDDEHCIIYCYIPKVASTNWKKFMFVLNLSEPYQDLLSIPGELVHQPEKLTHLNSFQRPEIKAKLRHYTKFLFVRDPFTRLISAYRDKLLGYNDFYYKYFGWDILQRYGNMANPPKTKEEAFASGVRPSFHNFIQYLLDPQTQKQPFDSHWRHMHHLCNPCTIQYDFIGHQETLQQDTEQLLKMLKLQDDIKFPPVYKNVTSSASVSRWFSTVPLEDRRKLYELYEEDFRLFGYSKPSELLDG